MNTMKGGEKMVEATQITNAKSVELVQQKNSKEKANQDSSPFAMLLQSLAAATPNQALVQLLMKNLNGSEDTKTMLNQVLKILNTSKKPLNELMSFFNTLPSNEQENIVKLFSNILNLKGDNKMALSADNNDMLKSLLEHKSDIKSFLQILANKVDQKGIARLQPLVLNNNDKKANVQQINKKDITITSEKTIPNQVQPIQAKVMNQVNTEDSKTDEPKVVNVDLNKLQIQQPNILFTAKTAPVEIPKAQPIENLNVNQDFSQELGKVLIKNLQLPNGSTETKIQLHPNELGQINVKLLADNGQITAQITASNALGKELLEGQIHQLKHSLIQQGYQVEKIEVQHIPTSSSSTLAHDLKNGTNFSGQQSQKQFSSKQGKTPYSFNYNEDADDFNKEYVSLSGIDYTA